MLSPAERSLSLQRNCTPVPPHTQKLTAPHLPSPDGAPCANASSSSRIFQHRLKLLPRPSGAAVLEPSASQSSGWGAARRGPARRHWLCGPEGRGKDPRSRGLRGPGAHSGCARCPPVRFGPAPPAEPDIPADGFAGADS